MESRKKRDFSAEAASWDDNPVRVANALAIADAVQARIPLSRDMDVLDYGSGTGLVTLALSSYVHQIVAADNAPGMLVKLAEKVSASHLTNVSTIALDLECDPFPSQRFDMIVSTLTMHHISDVPAMMGRFAELLKPGGYLAIADLDPDEGEFHADNTGVLHFGFERDQMRGILEKAGLEDIVIHTASRVNKPVAGKGTREFTVFLASGRKST